MKPHVRYYFQDLGYTHENLHYRARRLQKLQSTSISIHFRYFPGKVKVNLHIQPAL